MKPALLLLVAMSSYGLFINLDHVAFWDDEAQTAIFARHFLKTGKLTGWNGRELYGYRNGSLLREDFSIIQPPGDILLTALSFHLLGANEFAARLPFALCGLLALFLFVWILLEEGLASSSVVLGTAFFGLSTQFLLNSRQCRYYSLCLLVSLCFYLLWQRLLRSPSWPRALAIGLIAGVFYYSNYLLALGFVLTVFAISIIFEREKLRAAVPFLIVSGILSLTLVVPHAISLRIWDRHDISYDDSWLVRHAVHLLKYPRDLLFYFPTLLFIPILMLFRPFRNYMMVWKITCLFFGNALFVALLTPQPSMAIYSDFRFLIVSLPWAACLMGVLSDRLNRWRSHTGTCLLLIALSTNALILGYTRQHFHWTLPAFLISIHRRYATGIELASEYLSAHASAGETVFTAPEHFTYPIAYYTDIRACCFLDGSSTLSAARKLSGPFFRESSSPDWLVLFEDSGHSRAELEYFRKRFPYSQVEVLDVYFDQTQRPEPFEHEFLPKRVYPDSQRVFIFKRQRN